MNSEQRYGEIQVVNVKHCLKANVVYCGRKMPGREGSPLGNPFRPADASDGERERVIALYRTWLWEQLQADTPARREFVHLATRVAAGDKVMLGCWCAPKHCHCHVIADAVHSYNRNPEKFPTIE